jgi:hypothetical protein
MFSNQRKGRVKIQTSCVKGEVKRVIPANGKSEEAGLTEDVFVTIHGVTCEVKMLILPNDDKPILIGLDWMDDARAIVDVANKTIKFGEKSVYFTFMTNILATIRNALWLTLTNQTN